MKKNEKNLNRRNFLRMTAVTGAGAAFLPINVVAGYSTPEVFKKQEDEIPVRTLGRTGLQIPVLSMGVMRADNPSVLRAAYNAGIRHFDTANGYQNGRNEEMVGTFFADKPRDSFTVATKVGLDYPLQDDSEKNFMNSIDVSLKRLKMDYVDIFYIHGPRGVDEITDPQYIAILKKVKDSGKARFVGFSTHASRPEQLDAAVKAGIYDVILLSYNFKLQNLAETNAAVERAAKAGIGLVAMKTFVGGVEDANGNRKIDAKACLKWVWTNKNITTAIPGLTSYDQLDDCIAALQSPELSDDEKQYLASLRNSEMMFCQQCGSCVEQCPERLPIPDIMRAYMYTYGYKFPQLSKETLAELSLPDDPCSNCTNGCEVKECPSGFNVGAKIAAIKPVMNVPDVFLA